MTATVDRYCIIGAGAAGLATASNLQRYGLSFDVLERNGDVGGLWDYGNPANPIYASTHFISSSRLSGFPDHPMPADYPDYPSHSLALAYLRDYAKLRDLYQYAQFHTDVERVSPDAGGWRVDVARQPHRHYRGVVIATGHNWDPKLPSYPGHFDGEAIHSIQYKSPEVLKDKRVLIVGAGNSGCDIAVEAAQHARRTTLSVRRGYYFLPKHVFGRPADAFGDLSSRLRIPTRLRQLVEPRLVRHLYGDVTRYGLPKPDHRLYEAHPVVNSLLFYYLSHGEIAVRPDIARLAGRDVEFRDGTKEPFDIIIWATGYRYTYPFIDKAILNWRDTYPDLVAHMLVPGHPSLFMVGLYVNDGSFNVPAFYQAEVIAKYLRARENGARAAERIDRLRDGGFTPKLNGGVRYMRNERHRVAVRHVEYIRYLRRLSRSLD